MRVAIIGSRDFPEATGKVWMRKVIAMLGDQVEVITGGARGVDHWAENESFLQGLKVSVIRHDYSLFADAPKLAPLERNKLIVDSADVIIAFWHAESRGTAMAMRYATSTGKPVLVLTPQ